MNRLLCFILICNWLLISAAHANAPDATGHQTETDAAQSEKFNKAAQSRQQEQKAYEAQWARSPSLEKEYSLPQIAKITFIENDSLVFSTDLPASIEKDMTRVRVQGKNGFALVTAYQWKGATPSSFQFRFVDFDQKADAISVETQINWTFGNFNFYRIERRVGCSVHTTLGVSARHIVFAIIARDEKGGETSICNLGAEDLLHPRQDKTRAVHDYLRPLLAELSMEPALATDARQAWCVFADQWPVSPQLAATVQNLLPGLDADEWKTRAKATQILQSLGRDAIPAICRIDRTKLTVQQNMSIDAAMSEHEMISPQLSAVLKNDSEFLLDCLYSPEIETRKAALNQLQLITHQDLKMQLDGSLDARRQTIESWRSQINARPTTAPVKMKI